MIYSQYYNPFRELERVTDEPGGTRMVLQEGELNGIMFAGISNTACLLGIQHAIQALKTADLAYHNEQHVLNMVWSIQRDEGISLFDHDNLPLLVAVYFHDAVSLQRPTTPGESEFESVKFMQKIMSQLLPARYRSYDFIDYVGNLIMATATATVFDTILTTKPNGDAPTFRQQARWLCEADWNIFREPNLLYRDYALSVRKEYMSYTSATDYNTGRKEFLSCIADKLSQGTDDTGYIFAEKPDRMLALKNVQWELSTL